MTSIVQQNCQIIEPPTEKTWGRGWDVFGSEYKKAEHLTRFTKKKWANYWLQLYQEQQEDNLTDAICYLENICSAEQPFIS